MASGVAALFGSFGACSRIGSIDRRGGFSGDGSWPGGVFQGAAQQGPAIEQEPLGIAQTLHQARILLLGLLPLALQGQETVLKLHQPLRK